jgi:23S rRNA pseudouridine2604 synthase
MTKKITLTASKKTPAEKIVTIDNETTARANPRALASGPRARAIAEARRRPRVATETTVEAAAVPAITAAETRATGKPFTKAPPRPAARPATKTPVKPIPGSDSPVLVGRRSSSTGDTKGDPSHDRRDTRAEQRAGTRAPGYTPPPPIVRTQGSPDDGRIRLSKLMSERNLASRREADEWIAKGWVFVDGEVVKELGSRVLPTQVITVNQAAEKEQQTRVTILMNKPVGYVSGQAEDGHQPASVLFTAENRWEKDGTPNRFHPMQAKGLAPAGRLDIDSVGLLVFTQDGRVAKQLIGDNSEIEKEYLVRVEGTLTDANMKLLNHGLSLDGEVLRPAKVSWQNEHQLRFVLREGKKRQIRRMCELVGLTVVGLKRIRIGKITLGDLPAGQWRYLGPFESFA